MWSTIEFHFEFNQDAATQLHPQCKLYIYSLLTIQVWEMCVYSIYAWMLVVFYCSQTLVYVIWVWSHITLCIAPLWKDWMCRCLSFWCALVEWILESHVSRRDKWLRYFVDQMWKCFANLCLGALVVDSSVILSLVSILSYLLSCTVLSWIDVTEYDWVVMPLSWLSWGTS